MNQKQKQPEETPPQVVVIEDDVGVRESLVGLLRSMKFHVTAFSSATEFSSKGQLGAIGCMILDVRLPGQSGLEFYEEVRARGFQRPVIFMSGHADVPIAVRAMKAGAVEFLTKPVREQDLLDAVHSAMKRDSRSTIKEAAAASSRADYETLTKREQEVLIRVVEGQRNKQISTALGITEATVKLHRGNVMQKMHVHTLPELVRRFDLLGFGERPNTSTKG
ncbi:MULTISPECIES: response regulator transcription factor [Rhizobium]|uniref:FixJ family two-component response regulator n=1 Tax=Rhizobium esperanzae TaxID=1967781 RepID=A0A7W6XYG7_9HYPH|nr:MULTISPECIES: response regulator [Rhizobium]MBB4440739.1 FixJ family two-component response regulator [Rhizobium esperanzae]MDH6203462.1 FixJ family two-component response regulator [Rhizobium leguminosarum]